MKYIKLFEELSPSVYKNAGKKLIDIGQIKRGNKLINYSQKSDTIYDFNIFFNVFEDLEIIDNYSTEVKAYFSRVQIYLDGDFLEDTSVEEIIEKFEKDDNNTTISMGMDFYFNLTDEDVKKNNFESKEINTFSIDVELYKERNEISDDNHRYKISIDPPNDFVSLNNDTFDCGTIASRRSGNKLKNLIKYYLLDQNTLVHDFNTFLGGTTKQYSNFIKDVDNININKLCRDTSITNRIELN
jgi:hypothetical protein